MLLQLKWSSDHPVLSHCSHLVHHPRTLLYLLAVMWQLQACHPVSITIQLGSRAYCSVPLDQSGEIVHIVLARHIEKERKECAYVSVKELCSVVFAMRKQRCSVNNCPTCSE